MNRAFGLIEIIIGSSILTASLLGISYYFKNAIELSRSTALTTQASFILEESIEATRFLRDSAWANISAPITGTTYYLTFNGTSWATSTVNTYVDGVFERTVRFDDVYRDGSDDIVSVPGVLDPDIRKVTATVSWWNKTSTTTNSAEVYLANIF